jgi:hypothetical protein
LDRALTDVKVRRGLQKKKSCPAGPDGRRNLFREEGRNAQCGKWCYKGSHDAKRTKATKRMKMKMKKGKTKTRRTKERTRENEEWCSV